ncbi:unnamed protein product [Urochloa decumbens]|uniref:Uncharacterized protein n=1 Tax=Urochloa decumbens TaxID=240449 RepID=A0ABC9ENE1_9POAL
MAKAQAARFATEVAPPRLVSVVRRGKKVPTSLDTIAEDDREQQLAAYYGPSSVWPSRQAAPPARERAGGFVSELGSIRCFSNAHGQQAAAPAAGRVAITS